MALSQGCRIRRVELSRFFACACIQCRIPLGVRLPVYARVHCHCLLFNRRLFTCLLVLCCMSVQKDRSPHDADHENNPFACCGICRSSALRAGMTLHECDTHPNLPCVFATSCLAAGCCGCCVCPAIQNAIHRAPEAAA